jgi:type II secretory pathway pseudopilin PulG
MELLVVIAIILLLLALLIPALSGGLQTARSKKDMSQARGIHQAMTLHASGDEGRFPLPSRIADENNEDWTLNTTGNLMSAMIAQQYFTPDQCVSPVEVNPQIRELLVYDYAAYDGDDIFWDPAFNGDFSAGEAHNSYAHQALCGQRIRMKWNTNAGTGDLTIGNRGVRDGDSRNFAESMTLKFHGGEKVWHGVVIGGDGASHLVESFYPDFVAYQPVTGESLGPDNICNTDWIDVDPANPEASGDTWMTITNEAVDKNDVEVIWD